MYLHKSKLGEFFLYCLRFDLVQIRNQFPSHDFNPYFELFERHVTARNLGQTVWWLNNPVCDQDVMKWHDILVGCSKSIQDEASSAHFKKAANAFHHTANKNYRELRKYLNDTVEVHASSTLDIARYDFSYQKELNWPASKATVHYADAKLHWNTMMKLVRKSVPSECLLGYAWRLTASRDSSYSFHLVTITHKSNESCPIDIQGNLFEMWNATTVGKGVAFDCRSFQSFGNSPLLKDFKSSGIGTYNRYSVRDELDKVAFYMTQLDHFVRFSPPDNGRTFGKGNQPSVVIQKRDGGGT